MERKSAGWLWCPEINSVRQGMYKDCFTCRFYSRCLNDPLALGETSGWVRDYLELKDVRTGTITIAPLEGMGKEETEASKPKRKKVISPEEIKKRIKFWESAIKEAEKTKRLDVIGEMKTRIDELRWVLSKQK